MRVSYMFILKYLHFFQCFEAIEKKGDAGEGENGKYVNFEEVESSFGVKMLKSIKCTVCVCSQEDFGVDVFIVSEFVIKCDSKNFTILCIRDVVIVVPNWLKTCTGSIDFIKNCDCAFLQV